MTSVKTMTMKTVTMWKVMLVVMNLENYQLEPAAPLGFTEFYGAYCLAVWPQLYCFALRLLLIVSFSASAGSC